MAVEKRESLAFRGRRVVNVDSGDVYDVAAAAARIPWVKFRGETVPPTMPAHWYVVLGRCADVDWNVLAFAIAKHPESYLAYFRGYRTPNRYLELDDAIATGERSFMEHTCSIGARRTRASRRGELTREQRPRRIGKGRRGGLRICPGRKNISGS